MNLYNVMYKNEIAGKAEVTVEGLYTYFHCVCTLPQTDIFRIRMTCDGRSVDLGVCVPFEGKYVVNKKISTKHAGAGEMAFEIVSSQNNSEKMFIRLDENKAFPCISKLKNATLSVSNETVGILISD